MKVLVIGATGSIGRFVLQALAGYGHEVFGVARQMPSDCPATAEMLVADRSQAETITSLIRSHRIDAVIDMIAYTEAETTRLLDAIRHLVDRYVLISSADVYRNYGLLHRRETGAPDTDDLSESAALRTSRFPYRGNERRADGHSAKWMDDYDKIPIEAATQSLGCDWTILRLPMVFGPGDPQQRFRWALQPMLSDATRIDVPGDWLDWTTTYSYVENVADAIASAVGTAGTRRGVFNIVDAPPVSHSAWLNRFSEALNWTGSVNRATDPELHVSRATAGLDLSIPLKVSGRAFAAASGWEAPVSPDVVIARTVDDARRRWSGAS